MLIDFHLNGGRLTERGLLPISLYLQIIKFQLVSQLEKFGDFSGQRKKLHFHVIKLFFRSIKNVNAAVFVRARSKARQRHRFGRRTDLQMCHHRQSGLDLIGELVSTVHTLRAQRRCLHRTGPQGGLSPQASRQSSNSVPSARAERRGRAKASIKEHWEKRENCFTLHWGERRR